MTAYAVRLTDKFEHLFALSSYYNKYTINKQMLVRIRSVHVVTSLLSKYI